LADASADFKTQLLSDPDVARHLSRAELDSLVKDTGLDQQMKALGYWEQWQSGARGRKP